MNCPGCGLSNRPAPLRYRLLGATHTYALAHPCPQCGFVSEVAEKNRSVWESLSVEARQEARDRARREAQWLMRAKV